MTPARSRGKARVLHAIEIDKIAVVDFPCQELALATIAKMGGQPERGIDLRERIARAKMSLAKLRKARFNASERDRELVDAPGPRQTRRSTRKTNDNEHRPATRKRHRFEAMVDHIKDRDACSRTEAMQSARRECPELFQSYRS